MSDKDLPTGTPGSNPTPAPAAIRPTPTAGGDGTERPAAPRRAMHKHPKKPASERGRQ
ncbi:hypothetical protein ACFC1R_38405 [Kitasatospora sp. NPDC056138]|uniref:hypothetical protein n=1 Tax=Kitasatospora sp. NPDC056138 TaxID=3345724 RepID=UPI0035D9C162